MIRIPSSSMIRRMLVNRGTKAVRAKLIKQGFDAPSLDTLDQIRAKMVERGEAKRLAPATAKAVKALEDTVMPAIVAELSRAAEEGRRCPTNHELAAAVGRSAGNISKYIGRLEARGTIEIRQKAFVRAIKVVATGKATAGWDTIFDPPVRKHEPRVVVSIAPVSLRVSCPSCGCRLDADPSLCCARGRELRKLAA